MFYLTLLLQIFPKLCFCLKDIIKVARLLLAAVSINVLILSTLGYPGQLFLEISLYFNLEKK